MNVELIVQCGNADAAQEQLTATFEGAGLSSSCGAMAGNSDGRKGLLHPNTSSIERASRVFDSRMRDRCESDEAVFRLA
jgi:hypothetical protein